MEATTADWARAPRGGLRGLRLQVPPATFASRPVRRVPVSRSPVPRFAREHVRREPFSDDTFRQRIGRLVAEVGLEPTHPKDTGF